jgi:cytochrome b561
MTNPIDRYGLAPRFLHWLTVILVLVAWTLGTFGDDLPKGAARDTGLFVHISAGLLILMALVVRLAWRVAEPPPPLSRTNSADGWAPSPTRRRALRNTRFTRC